MVLQTENGGYNDVDYNEVDVLVYVRNQNLNKIIYNETINNKIILFMGAGSISKIASNFMQINE